MQGKKRHYESNGCINSTNEMPYMNTLSRTESNFLRMIINQRTPKVPSILHLSRAKELQQKNCHFSSTVDTRVYFLSMHVEACCNREKLHLLMLIVATSDNTTSLQM